MTWSNSKQARFGGWAVCRRRGLLLLAIALAAGGICAGRASGKPIAEKKVPSFLLPEDIYSTWGVKETADCIFLTSGDRISGRVEEIDPKGVLRLARPAFINSLKLSRGGVVCMIPAQREKILDGPDMVTLTNGLKIRGDVVEITAEKLVLKIESMGTVSIRRNIVASLLMKASDNVIFETDFSTGKMEPWRKRAGRWEMRDGKLRCLTPLSYVSALARQEGPVTVEWTVREMSDRIGGSLLFYIESTDAGVWGQNAIYIQPNAEYVQVSVVRGGTPPRPVMTQRYGRWFSRATFRAAYDADTGRLRIWVNNVDMGQCLIRPRLRRGTAMHLYCRNPSVYEHVRLIRGAADIEEGEKPDKDRERFVFINSDRVSGTLKVFRDGVAIVETVHGQLRLKKSSIQRIVFRSNVLGKPKETATDIRLVFHGGEVLAARLKRMDAEVIEASIGFLGDVKIRRAALSRILFKN